MSIPPEAPAERPSVVDRPSRASSMPPKPTFEEDVARLAPVIDAATRTPFFTLVASLERELGDSETLGTDAPPSFEKIRFRHDPSLAFSAGDVSRAFARREIDPEGGEPERTVVEVTTTFLGLTGGITPMPLYLAEEVAHEEEGDRTRGDFLDVFHHRAISLLYRLSRHYSIAEQHSDVATDPWTRRVLALAGIDAYEGAASAIPPHAWLRLAPLLAGRERGKHVLEQALREVLGDALPNAVFEVLERAGGMVELADDERCVLSTSSAVRANALGKTAVLGGRVRDAAGRFRIAIGPLDEAQYAQLLPEGELVPVLREIVDTFVPAPLEWDLELRVGGSRAELRLGHKTAPLGRSSWLGAAKAERQVRVGSLSNPIR